MTLLEGQNDYEEYKDDFSKTLSKYKIERKNLDYSTRMQSIAGVTIVSPLKTKRRRTVERNNVHSVRENYLHEGKKFSEKSFTETNKRFKISPQEHVEHVLSLKVIEGMRAKYREEIARYRKISSKNNRNVSAKTELAENKEPAELSEFERCLEDFLEDSEHNITKFMYFNMKDNSDNPYDLEVTTYNGKNLHYYYTISGQGVTQYKNSMAVDFVPLGEWLVERDYYAQVKEISFFQHFKRCKLLKIWRREILYTKRKQVIDELGDKLFYLNDIYRDYILQHRKTMCKMSKFRLIEISRQSEDVTVDEFSRRQKKKQKIIEDKIAECSNTSREKFVNLIEKSLDRLKIIVKEEEKLKNKKHKNNNNKSLKTNEVFKKLGFSGDLSYGHRAALRRECTCFLRLSYLIDFLAIKSLSDIYLNTIIDVKEVLQDLDINAKIEIITDQTQVRKNIGSESVLQIFIDFEPTEIPEENIRSIEIKEFSERKSRPKDFDLSCHIELLSDRRRHSLEEINTASRYVTQEVSEIETLWLKLNPEEDALVQILEDCMEGGIKVIANFERWSRHDQLTPYAEALEEWDEMVGDNWQPPESNFLDPIECIAENEIFQDKSEVFKAIVSSAYSKASDFLKKFRKYLCMYWKNERADYTLLFSEEIAKPIDTLTNALRLFEYQKNKFSTGIPEGCNIGILKIDCSQARKAISPSPIKAIKKIEEIGSRIVKKRLEEIKDWLDDSYKRLTANILTVEDYVNKKNAWNNISDLFQKMKDRVDTCGSIYNILTDFGLQIKKDDKAFHTQTLQEMMRLSQLIANVADQQELSLEGIRKKLKDTLIPELQVQLEEMRNEVTDPILLNEEEGMGKILERITKLEVRYADCESLTDKYRSYQQTLNMDAVDFPIVDEIREELELRSVLWKSFKTWNLLTESWVTQQFLTLNSKEIGPKAKEYTAIASRVDKNLPENTISKELKKAVDTFNKAVPLIQDLTNKALQKSHWDSIKKLLGADFDISDPKFTLNSLLSMNAIQHQEEISLIAIQASQEATLRKQLALIDEQWKNVTFTIKPYKYKDTYVLDDVDLLLNILDESLANINTILGSRYIKPLLSEAEGWRNSFLHLQALMEEWITCQKRWIYLENIFSGQDIKKQLVNEANKFETVDKFFKNTMQKAAKNLHPFKLLKVIKIDLLESFKSYSKVLDEIEKLLEDYLETKRKTFPRFYFLSNDELLEILANQQQLNTVQQFLRKCFDNLVRLEITEVLDIIAMISSEGERIPFSKLAKAKDNVEIWLDIVQTNMRDTLARAMKIGLHGYDNTDRKDWVTKHYSQAVATIAQISWCAATEGSILEMQSNPNALLEWYEENVTQIQQLTELVRGKLDSVRRRIIVALVTTDVHARDIIESLVLATVSQLNDFNWQKQLRYYWDEEDYIQRNQGCYIRQVAARLEYGYEYIGPSSRLVITPLTDRCWITITGALHIHLGAAPAGPAGTGKTESTKDLAKGLGVYCIVFNCSEQINYKMMARLFSGVVQQGAWTCLDEFNRINIEVLSVVARQVMDIRMALIKGAESFNFEEKQIPIKGHCGIFITMNPGYAGRTELPDNLKVHFRPVSMMIPDYQLIAEIMLFAEGFGKAKALSKKMVKLYKLASEQLSQQDHYDFGMRAVKSVLVMAGSLKRAEPELLEDAVLLRAMRDSNVPKFVKDDLPLFHALIRDLFPTLEVQPVAYGELQKQIEVTLNKLNLQNVPSFLMKTIQLYEVSTIRFGVMIVGPTGGGKTSCFEVLRDSIIELHKIYPENEQYYNINLDMLNPKSIDLGELYGEVNTSTQEWRDGLASKLIRRAAEDTTNERFWIVFDGPVDSLWIENMNTVLDDTMTLCLSNGQRIKLRSEMKMLFEVQDLAVASPATVSRCGMVYMASDTIGWRPYVESWIKNVFKDESVLSLDLQDGLLGLFDITVERGLSKVRIDCNEHIKTVDLQLIASICNFLEIFMLGKGFKGDNNTKKKLMQSIFAFSFIWGLTASIDESSKERVISYITLRWISYFEPYLKQSIFLALKLVMTITLMLTMI